MVHMTFADLVASLDTTEATRSGPMPHCSRCGHFIPRGTVRKVEPTPGEADEHVYLGTCSTHGRVDVTWPEG